MIIRRHAAIVLGDRGLGAGAAAAILPALAATATSDADPTIRRLCLLALSWWLNEAQPYLATATTALEDPDPDVRQTAERRPRSRRSTPAIDERPRAHFVETSTSNLSSQRSKNLPGVAPSVPVEDVAVGAKDARRPRPRVSGAAAMP